MAAEVIPVREHWYILSTSARIDDRTRVLKHGDTFAVFDRFGDIDRYGTGDLGIFHEDTRFVSGLSLRINGARPLLLSSTVRDDNAVLAVDGMNPDLGGKGSLEIPRGSVHIHRSLFVWEASCYGRIRVHNYGHRAVRITLALGLSADFVDLFELRGTPRARRGRMHPAELGTNSILFCYEGLDAKVRRTRVVLDPRPDLLTAGEARYEVALDAGGEREYLFTIGCEVGPQQAGHQTVHPMAVQHREARRRAHNALREARSQSAEIYTSNEQFNDWLNRSLSDLHMMRTDTPHGPYPYAGVPWFCTAFGRDGIITALECLSFDPALARGVLLYLAATQAQALDPEQDAEPGKILHETRSGEMAMTGEVPFRRYYGSVDATPLFVVLAGAHYQRTGDLRFAASLWPHVDRALEWMDGPGDPDGDGFVEYARHSRDGLIQQGWKDSADSVFHSDGSAVTGAVALCEVQGYVYAAKRAAAELATVLGEHERAKALRQATHRLRERFEAAFWCEELSSYALALDGGKRPCKVRTSNAGQCLFSGISDPNRAQQVAATLVSEDSFSGWGIRTLAAGQARFNPMSYHNGSVWPHDNALIAAGFARYNLKEEAARILTGLFDASLFFDLHRLPELFCGFPRRPGEAPTLYPVACAPQTWASASVFLLLESCLGLRVRGDQRRVVFSNPWLPPSLNEVNIRGLRVADASLDLLVTRHRLGDVGVNILRRHGEVEVVISK